MTSDQAYVFIAFGGAYVPAGLLRSIGKDGYTFRYGNKYLERPDRISIDPVSLPLSSQEFLSQKIFNVFRDAAPDRWGRRLLSIMASRHYGEMQELEILTALHSGERPGALAFGPTPEKPQSMAPWAQQLAPISRQQELATVENLLSETAPFGLHTTDAEEIFEEMCEVVGHWEEHFARCGISDKDTERLESRFALCQEVVETRPKP